MGEKEGLSKTLKVQTDEVYKITGKQFDVFVKEAEKWIKEFGLIGWEVFYNHAEIEGFASCHSDLNTRTATITLNKTAPCKISDIEVKRSAFHEVCELLLARFKILAKERFLSQEFLDEENHNIIRTLERVLYKRNIVKLEDYGVNS